MKTKRPTPDEFDRVRKACANLGADREMTRLVLASHRHNPALLEDMLAKGQSLSDYVRYKLAVWEAILKVDDEPSFPDCASGLPVW